LYRRRLAGGDPFVHHVAPTLGACTGVGVGDVLGRDADNFVGTQATAHTEFHRNALNGVIKFVQQLLDLSF
jgi:hypothetical protein